MVTVGEQRGYINVRNEFVIPAQYDDASAFKGGRTVVSKKGGPYQAIDLKGRVLFTFPAGTEGAATDYPKPSCGSDTQARMPNCRARITACGRRRTPSLS